MQTHSSAFSVVAAILAISSFAEGAAIFTDTFDSGTSSWFRAGSVGDLTNNGGQLSWVQNGAENTEVIGKAFPTTNITTGQTLRLSFDYTPTGSPGIIRVGFYNLSALNGQADPTLIDGWSGSTTNIGGTFAGYTTFLRDAGTPNVARYENGNINDTITHGPLYSGTEIGTNSTNYDIIQTGSQTYTVVYEVTRTGTNQMTTLFTLSSGGTTHVTINGSTSTIFNNFNMVGFRSADGTALLDNFVVEVIPEPSAALLGAIGLIAGCGFRKRRA